MVARPHKRGLRVDSNLIGIRDERSESAGKKAGVAAWRVAGLGLTGLHVLALSAGDALRVWRTASPGPNDAPLLVGGQSAANFACVSARASRGARYQPGYDHVLRKQRRRTFIVSWRGWRQESNFIGIHVVELVHLAGLVLPGLRQRRCRHSGCFQITCFTFPASPYQPMIWRRGSS